MLRRTNCYRRLRNNYYYLQALVNNALTWQSSCVIANNARKQQKLFVQGYNLEVHNVMKYTRKQQKHRAIKCYRRLRNNYACLQALVNNKLTWQSSCVIANNAQKQQKLFVQGYNLEVHDVIKYTRKHCATDVTNYITCK